MVQSIPHKSIWASQEVAVAVPSTAATQLDSVECWQRLQLSFNLQHLLLPLPLLTPLHVAKNNFRRDFSFFLPPQSTRLRNCRKRIYLKSSPWNERYGRGSSLAEKQVKVVVQVSMRYINTLKCLGWGYIYIHIYIVAVVVFVYINYKKFNQPRCPKQKKPQHS